ncbi:glycosyltransferase family 1 protein [Sphingomonas paeninsulae]|uniref:Glycosyltransferase family 1 protein n=1 Tax=Sphingomonas paeninsulae TaxID=2319844 RepID=A0A494TCE1_SPHPE|nr:glycosyltransferase family 1 protein [Sphingomonas paeninsulae]AYJ87117.1 glycosyltransferase family 1 protein [Sphingomonas paeninsulae]
MRIIIDMQACQSPFSAMRGVGRYTDNLVRALLAIADRHEIYLAFNGALVDSVERLRQDFSGLVPPERMVVFSHYLQTQFAAGREITRPREEIVRVAEIAWQTFLNAVQPDIIFSPNLQEGFSDPAITSVRGVKSSALYVTTLHDLIPYHFEDELLSDSNVRDWYEEKIRYVVNSDVIVTVSHATRNDMVEILSIPEDKIHVIHSGFDATLFRSEIAADEQSRVRLKYGLGESFIFYFGGGDPCKNIARLLKAYSLLDETTRQGVPLVLGGKSFEHDRYGDMHNILQKNLAELGLDAGNVITPGFIADADLPALLAASSCFIVPSTFEGFGLPALEAMACGAPVIGSNQSGVAEVIANPNALFDPYDPHSISQKIHQVLEDGDFRSELRQAGLMRAADFSWASAAKEFLAICEKAFGERRVGPEGYSGEPLRKATNAMRPFTSALDGTELSALARTLDESFPPPGRTTLYLDVSSVVLQDDRSGIQRVTRAIATEMLDNPPSGILVELIYASPDHDNFYRANEYKRSGLGLEAAGADDYVAFQPGDFLVFLDLAPRMAINHHRYIRYLRDMGVSVYFFVHDLIPLQRPEWFSAGGVEEFREWMDTVVTADGALCSSEAVANDVRDYVLPRLSPGHRPYRIGYSHLGTDIARSAPSMGLPVDAQSVLAELKARPTFLMLGTLEPRKAHRQALAAFQMLWREGIGVNLVIVGRWGWKMGNFDQELRDHREMSRRLFWLNGISDAYLELIFAECNCLLAASEAEGFGLPLVEAAQRGLLIIARDIPVFREVTQGHAEFFPDTQEPAAIADTVRDWTLRTLSGSVEAPRGIETRRWRQTVDGLKEMIFGGKWLYNLP